MSPEPLLAHFERFESYVPVDLTNPKWFLAAWVVVTLIVVLRYFIVAGSAWLAFYRWQPSWARRWQIYATLPSTAEQRYEIKWSLVSSAIFGFAGVLLGVFWQMGWAKFYLPFNQYGWIGFLGFPLVALFLHDAYFYWTHRWLHLPRMFRRYHLVHHASRTPSPWASFSFHPVEALIEALPLPLISLIVPMHPTILLAYLTFMTVSAVTNHSGFEILPSGSANHPFGRWLISGVHHSQHHRSPLTNFGLFFTWWDRWFGTENHRYAEDFERVRPRRIS